MKKIILSVMTAFLSLTFVPTPSQAETNPPAMTTSKPIESAEANALVARLNEINSMDKSNMSAPEKKQLRKEVRGIKSQLKELGGEVYLSLAAIIIIILLLVLLL